MFANIGDLAQARGPMLAPAASPPPPVSPAASFVKSARVTNKILTALLPREVLATLLPRFPSRAARKG